MHIRRPIALGCLFLAGCQSAPVEETQSRQSATVDQTVDQQWHPSTLSPETIAKADAAVLDYRKCLARETNARAEDRADPRNIANTILKTCEDRMQPIREAYDAEHVPTEITERYLRKNRSRGAQSVLRSVMAVHAMRSAEEEESKDAAKADKSKAH